MGVPGAGKSRRAEEFATHGYLRLNRDERGGSLGQLGDALEASLASGARRIVLDNTYLSRAVRSHVVGTAARHGVGVRCIWIDTPLAQAQVNLVERLLDRFSSLPDPRQLQERGRTEPGLLSPTRQMRAFRELEPPSRDEGFISVERVIFKRSPRAPATASGKPMAVFVAAAALRHPGWERALASGALDAPHLVFDWRPGAEFGGARRRRCSARGGGEWPRDELALPSLGWGTGLLVPAAVARAHPGIRARPGYRTVAVGARRRSTRAPHARHRAWRHVSGGERRTALTLRAMLRTFPTDATGPAVHPRART